MDTSSFVDLLAKYKMTFHWGAINKEWWIIGQIANGCDQNSVPAPAESFYAAQMGALNFIQRKYKLALTA